MNILQIISGRDINGALVHCKLLSTQLRDIGHSVTVLSRSQSWINDQLKLAQIPFFTSEMARFPPAELKRVARWIRDNQVDVIHTHMSRGNSFGVLLKLMTGVPVVATAHSRSFQLHWKLNDYVIANSKATYDYQHRVNRLSRSKLETVHCFIDVDNFKNVTHRRVRMVRRQLRLKGDEFVIGLVGDVVARKGQIYLFRALSEIVKEVPNLKLVILGRFHRNESYTKQLRAILIQENLYRRTKWLGLRFNVQDFMAAFDLCVVPSIEEPLGLVAIESMAAGTPVVATNVGGLPEIVAHEETGLLVEPRNSSALAKAIIRIAKDADWRQQLGENGRRIIDSQFDPVALTEKVVSVYDRVLSRRRAA